ncbi:MAG TPA: hypothetical protein VFV43_09065 [Limnobacter sp.]|nr:hypothetical protein [Limnobacter sp.]
MNQNDRMREALRGIQISAEDCANGNYPWPHKQNYSDIAEHARRALSHVNETPKNEHDSDDVLKPAPLVRLTDIELVDIATANFPDGAMPAGFPQAAHAIMDAMEKLNNGERK